MSTTEAEYLLIGSGVAAVTIAERLLSANPSARITIFEAGKELMILKDQREILNSSRSSASA